MTISARTLLLTAAALLCFAANSILCRLALAAHNIDPAAFTAIRLASGALLLAMLVAFRNQKLRSSEVLKLQSSGTWLSGMLLFAYAAAFSFAYVGLGAGTGALILFGCVQLTMILASILTRERPSALEWIGLAVAFGGLVYLVAPSLNSPPLDRALLMAVAGIAWGLYSLRGRGVADPIATTAGNFVRAIPYAILLFPLSCSLGGEGVEGERILSSFHSTPAGVMWAILSGAITSGLGYVMWYVVVPSLGATRAAIVQLLVPIVAAAGGVLLLGEALNPRLAISAALTLSGVALALRIIKLKWTLPKTQS